MKFIPRLFTSLLVLQSQVVYAESGARLQQCAVDLCGPASNYARITARGAFSIADRESLAFIQSEIDPKLQQILKDTVILKKSKYTLAEELLKTDIKALNPYQRSYLTVRVMVGYIQDIIDQVLTSTDGRTLSIDAAKLKQKAPKLTDAEVQNFKSVLDVYLGSDSFQTSRFLMNVQFDLLVQQLGNERGQFFNEIQKAAIEIRQRLGLVVEAQVDMALVARLNQDAASFTVHEKASLIKSIQRISRLAAMIEDPLVAKSEAANITMQQAATYAKFSETSKKMKVVMNSSSMVTYQKNQVLKTCHEAVVKSLAATPSELRQRKANELLERVKEAAKKITPKYFTGASLEAANQAINTVKFTKPNSLSMAKEQSHHLLDGYLDTQKRTDVILKQAATDAAARTSMAVYAVTETTDDAMDNQIFQAVLDLCDSVNPPHFVDAAYRSVNTIQTGWQSNMFPEIGVGVLAHEMGHIVSFAVTNNVKVDEVTGFLETRMCSAKGHAALAGSSETTKFTQFAEEDWADAFAASTLMEIKKTWPYTENFACALIEIDEKKDAFTSLELMDSTGTDTHSSSFLRALQTQVSLGKALPKSCVQSLSEIEKNVINGSCSK